MLFRQISGLPYEGFYVYASKKDAISDVFSEMHQLKRFRKSFASHFADSIDQSA